jgi:hypothetical protein
VYSEVTGWLDSAQFAPAGQPNKCYRKGQYADQKNVLLSIDNSYLVMVNIAGELTAAIETFCGSSRITGRPERPVVP